MELVTPKGEALPRPKAPHDPQQVAQFREKLSKDLGEMQAGWVADMQRDPTGGTAPNEEVITAHWREQWANRLAQAAQSKLPVLVDADALDKFIAARTEQWAKAKRKRTYLHQLDSLDEWEFRKVGECMYGTVWISSHLALAVATNGEVRVHLVRKRKFEFLIDDLEKEFDGWLAHLFTAINYSVEDLMNLVQVMRLPGIAAPLPFELESARKNLPMDVNGIGE